MLERVSREGETLLSSSLKKAASHYAGQDGAPEDRIEIWGKRVGRALGTVFVIILVLNLFTHWFF